MMMATMRKKTCVSRSIPSTMPRPTSPMPVSATPKSTAKKTTCSTSPLANASTTLDGTTWVRKSTNFICSPACAYREMSPFAIAVASSPAPGFVRFTTIIPMASAKVVTTSK